MFTRLRKDPFSTAMLRVLVLVLIVIAGGFIAVALDAPGINMSTTAGVLVGSVAAIAVTFAVRNTQLKARETAVCDPTATLAR
jgi:hypothetical protein